MLIRFLLILTMSFLFVGCETTTKVAQDQNNLADVKLAEAAADATHSLRKLAEIEQAIHPKAKVIPPPNPSSYGMAQLASLDWAGPVEPLIKRIATASGYHMKILGRQPATPILVSISAKNTPLGDILRDVGFQAAKRANIIVYPSSKVIELRYANS